MGAQSRALARLVARAARPMKIVFFVNGGQLALLPLQAVAREHDVVAVVRPHQAAGGWARRLARFARLRPPDLVDRFLRAERIPLITAYRSQARQLVSRLQRLEPDLSCIATFPWLLSDPLLALPRKGTINIHPSLLPRHRGPAPYFWVYYHDDRRTGVTAHIATRKADAGPVVLQEAFDLPRGRSIEWLHDETARRAAGLMARAVSAVSAGPADLNEQDEQLATSAPRVKPGVPMVPFGHWDVERVWHFLAGLCPQFREPLVYSGRAVEYRRVLGFARADVQLAPGTLTRESDGWWLHCHQGYIRLEPC